MAYNCASRIRLLISPYTTKKINIMRYLNNPANIRYNLSNKWLGQIGSDNGFCEFDTIEHGIRAFIIVLRNYIKLHGCRSVEKIIRRFAPVSENPTNSYISFCRTFLHRHDCKSTGIAYNSDDFLWLCLAMMFFESRFSFDIDSLKAIIAKYNLYNY